MKLNVIRRQPLSTGDSTKRNSIKRRGTRKSIYFVFFTRTTRAGQKSYNHGATNARHVSARYDTRVRTLDAVKFGGASGNLISQQTATPSDRYRSIYKDDVPPATKSKIFKEFLRSPATYS